MIKLNDQATDNGVVLHNHSHSNLSLLSEEKNSRKFTKAIDSISPISFVRSMKKKDECFSQNSNKFKPKVTKKGLMVPNEKSPTKSYQSMGLAHNPKLKKKAVQGKRLHDNLTSASSIPQPFHNNPKSGLLNNKTTIESTHSGTKVGHNSFRVNGMLI